MSSIQSALMSNPMPLAKVHGNSPFKPKSSAQSPEKVAKDFESVFSSMVLKEMRSTLEPGSLFSGDTSDVYGGMFDQFMGQHMSESGGMGLAKMVREALEQASSSVQQTVASPNPVN